MSFKYSPQIATDGLVFAVDAANPKSYISGDTTCNSLISNVTGTINNMGPTDEFWDPNNGGSWIFDGTDDLIEIEAVSSLNPTNAITIEIWAKPNASQGGIAFPILIGKGATNNNYQIFLQNGAAYLRLTNGSNQILGTTDLRDDQWHHIVGTYDGTTSGIYVDSVLENSYSPASGIATEGIRMVGIGASVSKQNEFSGQIALTRIYNKALSASEVTQNYNALKSRFI